MAAVFDLTLKDQNSEQILVLIGKLLAAYQETLITPRSPFDEFRDAVLARDNVAAATYPKAAIRGFRLFAGKGACTLCHLGPLFTSGEFGDIGITQFIGVGAVDQGRYTGIQSLLASPFNLLGAYNDDPQAASGIRSRHVKLQHRNFGEFRIPSLRNVSQTAPYMHNGSVATLEEVVDFYSELDEERLHTDGEKILRPLNLNAAEKADLVAFLKTL
jgi:cytochrome c peroxidase